MNRLGQSVTITSVLVALVMVLTTTPAAAQEPGEDVLVRVNGTVDFAAGENVDTLVAVNSPAEVAGTVRDTLVIVNQSGTVSGEVGRDVFIYNGTLRLEPTARVGGDVVLLNSAIERADGATVTGQVVERSGAEVGAEFRRATAAISVVAWLGMTLLFVVAAIVWAAIGGRQLSQVAGLLAARPGLAVVAAVIFWIVVPLLAVLAFVTVVGIPLGVALLLLLPVLWGLGYIATGTRLGFWLDGLRGATSDIAHPYLAAVAGVVIFQLIGLIPVIGGIVVAVAGLLGAGALVANALRRASSRGELTATPPLDATA
jgi:hypothetical protein